MFTKIISFFSNIIQSLVETIETSEIIYIVVGAIIGLFSSVAILIVERCFDKKGKMNIFYRKINQRGSNGIGWGFDESADGKIYFTLPVFFELQNTSNTTRVIRDVSILLYNDDKLVGKMYQLDGVHITNRKGNAITSEKDYYFGSEKGSYSFVLQPRSIQRQECEYIFSIFPKEKDVKSFNKLIARYHDEKNKPHYFYLMDISDSWESKHYDPDDEWIIINQKFK